MSARPEADPQLGRTLGGQYRIEALLGAGGMGRVYRGRQLSVNRAVAIKVIAGQAPYPPEWVRRFRREAEATASLSHPNSVRLFDFGVTESEELFMVMELLEGSDLARQLQTHGPLPLVAALAITRQVLLALCEAHALGITHRDIKPDNIFLANVRGADVVAKVMDFGIAGIAQAQRRSRLTGAGMIIGTPMYMSPEQAQGLRVDGKSDVYSLGVVLFEMLTGRPVFESHTAVTLLLAHVARPPMRLDEAGLQLREQSSVQALLDGLLAKDPSERPTAAEALDTVTALSSRLGIAGATGTMRALAFDAPASSSPAKAGARTQPTASAQSRGMRPPAEPGASRTPQEARRSSERAVTGASSPAANNVARTRTRKPTPPPAASVLEHSAAAHNTRAPTVPPSADNSHEHWPELDHKLGAGADGLQPPAADALQQPAGDTSRAKLGLPVDDASLARHTGHFRSARAASAPTGAWLQPGFALLGMALVLGAASALALRWGPLLLEVARPTDASVVEDAAPSPPPEPRTVLITSRPSGAHVLVEGEKVGTTPFEMNVQGDTEVSVAREGYVRQLVSVPYDARAPLLVKLAAEPTDTPQTAAPMASDDKPFFLSLRQESLPRIAPRADSDHERRERGARAPRAAQRAQESIARVEPEPGMERLPAQVPVDMPGPQQIEEREEIESAGLDVARVLEMGREGSQRGIRHERPALETPESVQERERAARQADSTLADARGDDSERSADEIYEAGQERERAAREALADIPHNEREHADQPPSARETSRSAATRIEAIREDEVAEIALDDDERAHVAQHYGLRAIGRAVARAFGRLLIPYPSRERRAALAKMPLMYSSFREARAAYKHREVGATEFQEAVWQLRERRRQRIWRERDGYARGELSQSEYQAKVDRIWDEFWGHR